MYSIQFSTCIYFLKWKHLLLIVRVMFQMKVFKTLFTFLKVESEAEPTDMCSDDGLPLSHEKYN